MEKLCLGCMKMKHDTPVCEHCGFDERTENLPHQLPSGNMLQNQYLVGSVLGQGGFGITYIGWDQNLSVPVAIKEYFPTNVVHRHTRISTRVFCANGEAPEQFAKHKERFLKEARTLAQLSDIPEIVQVKSFFPENDTAYIVMEYVEGITLKDHLKQLGRPMSEKEVLDIMGPVLQALQKVHDLGLIHRDISPDNIMLQKNGGIKLIDFGTVRYMDASGKSRSTETVLKPGFAPLEQYNTRGNLGPWTDVYAVCGTFYYLLTGKSPEEAPVRLDSGEKLELLHKRTDLSLVLIRALEKGMRLKSSQRIQTVKQLYDILFHGQDWEEVPSAVEIREKKVDPWRGRWKIAAAVLMVMTIGAWLLLPKKTVSGNTSASAGIPQTSLSDEPTAEVSPPVQNEEASGVNVIDTRYQEAVALEQEGHIPQAAIAFGKLGSYRDARERSFALWDQVAHREVFSAQAFHTVGLRRDGRVLAAGTNNYGQCDVSDWTQIIAISASPSHTVGLKADGTVVAAGANGYGQCDVSGWTDIVAIHTAQAPERLPAGEESTNPCSYTLGLRADGTVVAAGFNVPGQCNVENWTDVVYFNSGSCNWNGVYSCQTVAVRSDGTALAAGTGTDSWCDLSDWNGLVSISSAGAHVAGLKADGTVVAVYDPDPKGNLPPSRCNVSEWHDIVEIQTHIVCTIGRRSDGTMVAVGNNDMYRNMEVSQWKEITAFSVQDHTVGLRSDGTVVSVGDNNHGQRNISRWSDIAAVDTSTLHTVGIRRDGTAVAAGDNYYGQCEISEWDNLVVPD